MRFLCFGFLLATTAVAAQGSPPQSAPAFEVTSVKPNNTDAEPAMNIPPRGSIVITNVPLLNVITNAYGIPTFRIVGVPDWIRNERFDITATRRDGDAGTEVRLMLQALLTERFKLRVHRETREQPVYELVVARRDRQLGPRLQSSTVNCTTVDKTSAVPAAPDSPCGGLFGVGPAGGTVVSKGQPLARTVSALSMAVNRTVVDKTGLAGLFDLDLRWSSDVNPTVTNTETPSIFTALQEQLGLRLAPATAPVDVLVIDSVERPTPD